MKTLSIKEQLKSYFLFAALILSLVFTSVNASAQATSAAPLIKNVVLVHGAFADGSGWKGLYEVLSKKGYHVTIVQNPLSSLEDDVAATNLALDRQDGPTILVGHSWGGTVITEAGNHPKVAALVYVAALQPDNGENSVQWLQTAPPAKWCVKSG
ncbi:alpha/beta fold hydrolase [Flavobacterium salmonis]|uniref:Alpha/beta hydrolase n=1 Tax=Flavobacterium salmonis TaxID=2654844 RepID=A0A6V6Z4M4_9FLAO|nr:alpha/beta hydrolase [Flavobacterium salmonis]CAD0006740.1 alpha/beta hydrolase [Flavobacterium salmonis]